MSTLYVISQHRYKTHLVIFLAHINVPNISSCPKYFIVVLLILSDIFSLYLNCLLHLQNKDEYGKR